jgi:colanic acid biosynthesis glycosyl transferase WcaI
MAQGVVEALSATHDVTVLCGRPSYDPAERRPWRLWQTEHAGRTRIIRVGSTDYPRFQMTRRVMNYLSYVALSVLRALFARCDVVLAMTDPPFEGIVGAFVAMLKRKPYVYNIRDLYPDMAVGGAIVAPGMLARVWENLHRWAMGRARRVVVLGEDMRARIVAKGVDAGRTVVVRDGTEICSACAPALDPEVTRAIRGDFKFVVLHAGNLGFYGAWDTLLAAARKLADEGVGFVFVGDGAQRGQLEAAAGSLRNVLFLPFFPASKIPSVLAAADAHIVTIKRGLEGVVVPSKMYSILGAGKLILAVAPPETDVVTLTKQIGCGVSADPDKPEELEGVIRALVADRARVRAMGLAAQAAANGYDRASEFRKFAPIIEEAVGR